MSKKLTPQQRLDSLLSRKDIDKEKLTNYEQLLLLTEASLIHKKFKWQAIHKYVIEIFATNNTEGDLVDLYDSILACGRGVTLKKFKLLYGDNLGDIKWKEYCDKQALSNTFSYKQEKYNMSKEDFDEYNNSRACTLDNFIKRHGIKKGEEKWKEYCEKQKSLGSSLSYFVTKYGDDGNLIWREVNKKKALTKENFIRLYGEEFGIIKYLEYYNRFSPKYSKISQELFSTIYSIIGDSYGDIYYATNNKEFGKMSGNKYYFYDFVIPDKKFVIEFNGDIYHANPKKYSENDVPKFRGNIKTAKEIWDDDQVKIKFIEDLGFSVIIVWESDYVSDKKTIVERIIYEIEKS